MSTSDKPEWWLENPYFESAMGTIKNDDDYVKAIPDPQLRTCISWYLGNRFWELASDMILKAYQNNIHSLIVDDEIFDDLED